MSNETEQEILDICDRASTQFQHGDDSGMRALYSDSGDVTLFGALGGCAKGREQVEKILGGAARNLSRGGNARYEIISMVVEGTMAYFTSVERIDIGAEGLSDLRVTNILHKEGGAWRLLHRHADALHESPFA
jgi:ketosteroid isomerase-like protein